MRGGVTPRCLLQQSQELCPVRTSALQGAGAAQEQRSAEAGKKGRGGQGLPVPQRVLWHTGASRDRERPQAHSTWAH